MRLQAMPLEGAPAEEWQLRQGGGLLGVLLHGADFSIPVQAMR